MEGKESCYFWQSTNQEAEAAREDYLMESKISTDNKLKVISIKSCQGIKKSAKRKKTLLNSLG